MNSDEVVGNSAVFTQFTITVTATLNSTQASVTLVEDGQFEYRNGYSYIRWAPNGSSNAPRLSLQMDPNYGEGNVLFFTYTTNDGTTATWGDEGMYSNVEVTLEGPAYTITTIHPLNSEYIQDQFTIKGAGFNNVISAEGMIANSTEDYAYSELSPGFIGTGDSDGNYISISTESDVDANNNEITSIIFEAGGNYGYSHIDIQADELTLNGEPIGSGTGEYESETWTFFYSDGTTVDKEVLTKIVEEEPGE